MKPFLRMKLKFPNNPINWTCRIKLKGLPQSAVVGENIMWLEKHWNISKIRNFKYLKTKTKKEFLQAKFSQQLTLKFVNEWIEHITVGCI